MTRHLRADVVIVGGGIVGGSAALFLRQAGASVILMERDRPGSRASGVNYGGVRRQGRPPEHLPLSQRAHALWASLESLIGEDGEYVRSGHLKLARSATDMASLEAYAARVENFGLGLRLLDAADLRRLYPMVGDSAVGGSLCPEDGHANPRLVSPAFSRAAAAAGATILDQSPVSDVRITTEGFHITSAQADVTVSAPVMINCAGAWAGELAARMGETLPIAVIHPLMAVTEPLPHFLDVSIGVEGGGIYGRQVERGNFVFGGGRGFAHPKAGAATDSTPPDYARPERHAALRLLAQGTGLFPALQGCTIIRSWSGVEAETPDHAPIIGPSRIHPGLFHACGFSGAGFQIGPAVGAVLADLVTTGRSVTPLDAFRPDRFSSPA
ncbi:NAD(P)/FAD-dependent oxidoreductase [Novispirillum itersonii]|uniref:NAD(P)/FAD-dependent oxidoreductase n=1 Tax=Novispirillum itersonii TaxID=189 RepID=UPI0003617AAC|nr:FAD-binding oxidoreductase [Novispirillum itersonii]